MTLKNVVLIFIRMFHCFGVLFLVIGEKTITKTIRFVHTQKKIKDHL